MKKAICISIILCIATVVFGQVQQPVITSREGLIDHLETLFKEGRHAYADIGNKAQLKRVIEAYETAIIEGRENGMLTGDDEIKLMLYVKYHKLCGDFHYLNADEDYRSYDAAENHFQKALAFAEDPGNKTTHEAFYYQFILHQELAQLYYKESRYHEAYIEMQHAQQFSSRLRDDSDILNFISQTAMCEARVLKFSDAISHIDMVISSYPDKKSVEYGEALRKKAKILMLWQESNDTGINDPQDNALKYYKEYFTLKKEDALQRLGNMNAEDREQYWMRIRPFIVDCYRTETADPAFLYDVTLFGKSLLLEYAQKGKPQSFTWKQVQKKLQTSDCAVEFIQYEKYGRKQMGALILKKKGEPKFVKIGELSDIKKVQLYDEISLYDAVTYDAPDFKDLLYTDSAVFNQIWTPELLNVIGKDTKRLYFAADGLFHELAIEYMLPKAPELTSLSPESVFRLTSTRQLLVKTTKRRNNKVLLSGGINYSKASQSALDNKEADYSNDEQAYRFLKTRRAYFTALTGTMTEIEGIQNEFGSTIVTMLTDSSATETHVASLIKQYPIVHLATHGYYFGIVPTSTDLLPVSYDESLSQSGLAFAGSTAALKSNDFNTTKHDGILSSREIARMDFSNVDLIVLSACQTALGYMTDDGVYGLQRSLKNAGVKAIILSLWSVDDKATSLLMRAFYTHLQSEDTHTAFMHARQDLINTGRNASVQFNPELMIDEITNEDFNNPYYYNAFILIDVK